MWRGARPVNTYPNQVEHKASLQPARYNQAPAPERTTQQLGPIVSNPASNDVSEQEWTTTPGEQECNSDASEAPDGKTGGNDLEEFLGMTLLEGVCKSTQHKKKPTITRVTVHGQRYKETPEQGTVHVNILGLPGGAGDDRRAGVSANHH